MTTAAVVFLKRLVRGVPQHFLYGHILDRHLRTINKVDKGCSHRPVDSSAPSILPPRVRLQSTPSTLFSIYIVQIVYLSFELECEKNKNKQKEAGIGPFFKKQ